jgi:hypothetical protein
MCIPPFGTRGQRDDKVVRKADSPTLNKLLGVNLAQEGFEMFRTGATRKRPLCSIKSRMGEHFRQKAGLKPLCRLQDQPGSLIRLRGTGTKTNGRGGGQDHHLLHSEAVLNMACLGKQPVTFMWDDPSVS